MLSERCLEELENFNPLGLNDISVDKAGILPIMNSIYMIASLSGAVNVIVFLISSIFFVLLTYYTYYY